MKINYWTKVCEFFHDPCLLFTIFYFIHEFCFCWWLVSVFCAFCQPYSDLWSFCFTPLVNHSLIIVRSYTRPCSPCAPRVWFLFLFFVSFKFIFFNLFIYLFDFRFLFWSLILVCFLGSNTVKQWNLNRKNACCGGFLLLLSCSLWVFCCS